MKKLFLKELALEDEDKFLHAMKKSHDFYSQWMSVPLTHEEFVEFFDRYSQPNHKSFLLVEEPNQFVGVFNLSEIVRGIFQNAYLGFSVVIDYAGQGYMSHGLKLLLKKVFTEIKLDRIEANIQPTNVTSITFVKNNGFRKEGYSERYLKINGQWRDFERWATTYEDWLEHKNGEQHNV